ncbi:hypothetical protein [uncultured Aeromicrobium sp.]|uniref:arsenate reductase/protein-tyrosine-phosphatase family protein n=1 Tax=uncultured Aeromicrobium sp. TaxID=337820 RepID=UPI0025DE0104|nr:hypothetical protein [uncultured Aeromicrobium sp.]
MAFRILTVCTANVCRSPLAAGLLRRRLDSEAFVVESAGVRAPDGGRTDPHVVQRLTRRGIQLPDLAARQLTADIARRADLILTATRDHRTQVLEVFPGALRRTFTLVEFAALAPRVAADSADDLVRGAAMIRTEGPQDIDIADPIGQSEEFHDEVARRIEEAVDVIATHLMARV